MLVSLLVIILIVVLALYLVQIIPLDPRLTVGLQAIILVIAILYLLRFA